MQWHQLMGILLTRYFSGSACEVEVEVDLSRQQQRLDIVVVRRGGGPEPTEWPDGLDPAARFHLISFKAAKDTLDPAAARE